MLIGAGRDDVSLAVGTNQTKGRATLLLTVRQVVLIGLFSRSFLRPFLLVFLRCADLYVGLGGYPADRRVDLGGYPGDRHGAPFQASGHQLLRL